MIRLASANVTLARMTPVKAGVVLLGCLCSSPIHLLSTGFDCRMIDCGLALSEHGVFPESLTIMGTDAGMGDCMGTNEIDERGRVTIPKDIREKSGLKPNARVRITAKKNAVTIEKAVELSEFIDRLRGCITVKGELDPLHLKAIWRTNS